MTTQALAECIAETLFTNGSGKVAQRLVLELPGKKDGGGWCQQAVVDQVKKVLEEEEYSRREKL